MYLWRRKSPSNFGSQPDLDTNLGIFKKEFSQFCRIGESAYFADSSRRRQILNIFFHSSVELIFLIHMQEFLSEFLWIARLWRPTPSIMKKRSKETQTLHAGCSKVQPKIFAPLQTPFPGARDRQILISWRWSLPLTYKPTLVRIDASNFELSW